MPKVADECVQIVICADDYGLSAGIGQAIRDLIPRGRLTATSCMTTSDSWPSEAEYLRPLADHCDVGLHLTLTDQRAAAPMPGLAPEGRLPSLGALMVAAAARRLDRGEIEAEIERQIARFETAMGVLPAFVDGHQHVHQLPVVRDALLAVYERLLRRHGAWLRYCVEPIHGILTRRVAPLRAGTVALLGRRFARDARSAGIRGNTGFRGVRSFAAREDFPSLMGRFLSQPKNGMVIMCHPGIPDDTLSRLDRVVEPRMAEYAYLRSSAFGALLSETRVSLARLGEIVVPER